MMCADFTWLARLNSMASIFGSMPPLITPAPIRRWVSPTVSVEYDVARFEAQAGTALGLPHGDWRRVQALAVAVELYTGDYLADMPVDWAQERRQALSALHVEVRRAYADELIKLTRYAEAREVITRALAIEPFRDDLHERMLYCLAGLGRRHEIIDHYRRYRDLLRVELGIDPSPALRTLYARLIE